MAAVLNTEEVKALLSAEHFSVDGTLIQAWASMKSFRRKDGKDEPPSPGRNGERRFQKEKRSNETHASTTDPDARLVCGQHGVASGTRPRCGTCLGGMRYVDCGSVRCKYLTIKHGRSPTKKTRP